MKLGDWKTGLRSPRPKAVEASPFDVERFGVVESVEPASQVLRFPLKDLALRTRLSVEATSEASSVMRSLGHPGNLMVECDKTITSDSVRLMFYGQSGEAERVKQVFQATFRHSISAVDVIITPFRSSAVYDLMNEADSAINGVRLYEACKSDLRMLRGWPPETEFEVKLWKTKGVDGRVVFQGGLGRARGDCLFHANLEDSKLSASLPLFPHSHLEIPMSALEDM